MLCEYCKDITINRLFGLRKSPTGGFHRPLDYFIPGAFYRHQPTYNALIESAICGCTICHALWKEFCKPGKLHQEKTYDREAFIANRIAKGESTEIQICLSSSSTPFDDEIAPCFDILSIGVGDTPPYPSFDPIELKLSAPRMFEASLEGSQIGRFDIEDYLGGEGYFDIATDWLETCIQEHTLCPTVKSTPLPTRVIDVSSEEPFLFVSEGQSGSYVALSHCWGGHLSLITTLETLPDRRKGISMDSMPANFRDAVIITRELGIRYVWIDALCIVQNSREDWEIEAAQMCDIYQNAVLTIAGSAAKDSTVGLLTTSKSVPSDLDPPFTIDLDMPEGKTIPFTVTRFDSKEENWYSCIGWCPLATRAWTLQEERLSPRLLSYGTRQIYWRCRQSSLCADGAPEYCHVDSHLFPDFPTKAVSSKSDRLSSIYGAWHSLLGSYTIRDLTQKTDKLPALAGLATRIQSLTDDIYLAGIWYGDLKRSLCWYIPVPNPKSNLPPPKTPEPIPGAPSWTWARIHAAAGIANNFFSGKRIETSADALYVSHDIHPVGKNVLGEVKESTLTLDAHILIWKWEEISLFHLEPLWDFYKPPHIMASANHGETSDTKDTNPTYAFLLVAFSPYRLGPLCPHVLILRPVHGEKEGFERVGYVLLTPKFLDTAPGRIRGWSNWPRRHISLV